MLGQTKPFIKGTASVHQGQSRPPYNPTAWLSFKGIERVNAGEGHVMLSLDRTGRTRKVWVKDGCLILEV